MHEDLTDEQYLKRVGETREETQKKKIARENYDFEGHRKDKKERLKMLNATRGRWTTWEEHLDFQERLEKANYDENAITKPYKEKKKKKVAK